jgi:transposase
LPVLTRFALHGLVAQLRGIEGEIEKIEAEILEWHRTNETSRRLATIPGIGQITASAIAASVPDTSLFRSGRQKSRPGWTDAEVP